MGVFNFFLEGGQAKISLSEKIKGLFTISIKSLHGTGGGGQFIHIHIYFITEKSEKYIYFLNVHKVL